MGLLTWLQRTLAEGVADLNRPRRPEAPADDSPVVPADSPALHMVVRQAELEARHHAAHLAAALGTGDGLTYALGGTERQRRQHLAAKVRRGAPVTQRELLEATTGYTNAMGTSGDAVRVALAVGAAGQAVKSSTGVAAGPSCPAPPPATPYDLPVLTRDLEGWLRFPPDVALQALREQLGTTDRFGRIAAGKEVVAICWARTMLGEARVRREDLPAALDEWLVTDRLARQPGSSAPVDLRDRAWHVDRVTAAVSRATPHAHAA